MTDECLQKSRINEKSNQSWFYFYEWEPWKKQGFHKLTEKLFYESRRKFKSIKALDIIINSINIYLLTFASSITYFIKLMYNDIHKHLK